MRVPAVAAWVAIAALGFSISGSPARAVSEAWLVYQGTSGETLLWQIPVFETTGSDGATIGTVSNWSWQCGPGTPNPCADDGFRIEDLDVTLDSDPVISFGQSALDFGASSTFGYIFVQPIVATAAPGTASSSLSGSTTNGGGAAGSVSVTPAPPPAGISQDAPGTNDEIMVYSLSTDGGATWLNVGIDLGPAFTSNPALTSDNYGPFNSPSVAGPATLGNNYDTMRVDVNFTLSGGNDRFTFNGDATILEEGFVPEPATAAQLALGLLGFGLIRRRRRS